MDLAIGMGMPGGQGSAVRKCQTQLWASGTLKSGRADKGREVEKDLTWVKHLSIQHLAKNKQTFTHLVLCY